MSKYDPDYESLWDKIRSRVFDKKAVEHGLVMPKQPSYSWYEAFKARPKYENKMKKKKPVQFFLYMTLPDVLEYCYNRPVRLVNDAYWNTKRALFDRYDIVKVYGQKRTKYCDKDSQIEGLLQTIIFDYFEVESSIKDMKFQMSAEAAQSPEAKKQMKELIDAYYYFKKERGLLLKQEDKFCSLGSKYYGIKKKREKAYATLRKIEKKRYELDDKYFTTIVKGRHYLWT